MNKNVLVLFGSILVIASMGCSSRKQEDTLQKWEDSLARKEDELTARAKTLDIREAELRQKELQIDSLTNDSSLSINPALAGLWNVKMSCTETTCAGSAVGDTKAEQWELSYQGHLLLAKAISDTRLIRIYTGQLNGNTADLIEQRKDSTQHPGIMMSVRLRIIDNSNMEGEREIVREKDCKIVYAISMQKQS